VCSPLLDSGNLLWLPDALAVHQTIRHPAGYYYFWVLDKSDAFDSLSQLVLVITQNGPHNLEIQMTNHIDEA